MPAPHHSKEWPIIYKTHEDVKHGVFMHFIWYWYCWWREIWRQCKAQNFFCFFWFSAVFFKTSKKVQIKHILRKCIGVLCYGALEIVILLLSPSVLWHCWLGGRKGIQPVKNWLVGCWHGYLSGARCRIAYGTADAIATHCLLLQ